MGFPHTPRPLAEAQRLYEQWLPRLMPEAPLVVRLPAPQPLQPGASAYDDARVLVAAYRGALAEATGQPCRAWARLQPTSPVVPMLVRAAALCREHNLTAAQWARWSVATWRDAKNPRRDTTPTLQWLWTPKRIERHHGWCRAELRVHDFAAATALGSDGIALRARWRDTRGRAMAWVRMGFPYAEIASMVRRDLGADFEQRTAAYNRKAVSFNAQIRIRAERGEYVW
jgi:hypothetical protein